MLRLVFALFACASSAAAFAAPPAATLASVKGSVLVNQGKQFVTVQKGQLLAVGDRVLVMEGGTASLKFADGCEQMLEAGTLATVQTTCNSGSVTRVAALTAQAVGEERDCDDDGIVDSKDDDIDGDGKLNADDKYESCKAGAIWWLGGAAAIGAAALISNGDDATISP